MAPQSPAARAAEHHWRYGRSKRYEHASAIVRSDVFDSIQIDDQGTADAEERRLWQFRVELTEQPAHQMVAAVRHHYAREVRLGGQCGDPVGRHDDRLSCHLDMETTLGQHSGRGCLIVENLGSRMLE